MSRNERRAKQLFGGEYPYKREKKRLVNKFRNRHIRNRDDCIYKYHHGISVYVYSPGHCPFPNAHTVYGMYVYTSKPKCAFTFKDYLRNTLRYVWGIYN